MAHSTGSETRLNRLKPSSFGSDDYAREELVAELCAALLCQRYGMFKYLKDDSVPYLKDWLENLKKEPSFIKTVLVDVKKASSMVIDHVDKLVTKLREGKEGMTEEELNQEKGSEEQESSNYAEELKESDDENEEVAVRTSRR
jgi:antirestriction protein ArdC